MFLVHFLLLSFCHCLLWSSFTHQESGANRPNVFCHAKMTWTFQLRRVQGPRNVNRARKQDNNFRGGGKFDMTLPGKNN